MYLKVKCLYKVSFFFSYDVESRAEPAKTKKAKLYCKQFLETGECDRTKRGEKCDPHLTAAMLAALKNIYGENLQGYYNPK